MFTNPPTPFDRRHRAKAVVMTLLASAALLALPLPVIRSLRPPPAPVARVPVPGQDAPDFAAACPRWQADLRTAYHAALYLLDPRV